MRSSLNLFGTTLDVETGEWIEGIHFELERGLIRSMSIFLKAHILFGKEDFWRMFHSAYVSVQKYFRHGPWCHEADMRTRRATYRQLISLQAFWPGLQVLFGHITAANSTYREFSFKKKKKKTRREFYHVWEKFGVLPERYLLDHQMLHPTEKYYPLRPEFAESTFYLYQATKNPWYIEVGESIINSLNTYTRVEGGFASIRDVKTMELEDHQQVFSMLKRANIYIFYLMIYL